MTINITDADVFEDPVVAPATGDDANQATFLAGLQDLANRTRYIYNRLGTVPTLAANRILARASTGATEGKPSTDFSLSMVALGSAPAWSDALDVKGSNIASASTTNIAGATGTYVHVTGTTTITSFGTAAAGARRVVRFDGSLTLTASGNLITPTGRDLQVAANDLIEVVSEGGGVWRVLSFEPYQRYLLGDSTGSVFFGDGAGNLAGLGSIADECTGFGHNALGSLTDGQYNTAFGSHAGSNLTTGQGNCLFGVNAGSSLVDGSGNILIGNNVDAPAPDSNDYLSIGDIIFGDLSGDVIGIGDVGALGGYNAGTMVLAGDLAFAESGAHEIFQTGEDGDDLTIRAQDASGKAGGDLILFGGDGSPDGGVIVSRAAGRLGFFEATGTTKGTISGSTQDGTALRDLLDTLAGYGLIDDVSNDS